MYTSIVHILYMNTLNYSQRKIGRYIRIPDSLRAARRSQGDFCVCFMVRLCQNLGEAAAQLMSFRAQDSCAPTTWVCARLDVLDLGTIGAVTVGAGVRGPECQVVAEELHDERGVLVGLLREGVELSDRIVECLLRDVARAIGAVEDLVVEDGEVEREAEADGVRRGQVLVGDGRGLLVRVERLARRRLALVSGLELGEVPVVVALHLEVEDAALVGSRVGDELAADDGQDLVADRLELGLDLALVVADERLPPTT